MPSASKTDWRGLLAPHRRGCVVTSAPRQPLRPQLPAPRERAAADLGGARCMERRPRPRRAGGCLNKDLPWAIPAQCGCHGALCQETASRFLHVPLP
ncbi:hypothetical protein NDU88_001115 [Pleurodeles waltl]|uniref:Uncharacterized protein n=1 Tax=Pleurodeles waltl TaxID=8319 RepID=A0AAV7KS13_PLEWA|nr:hypothetical protein NDU88_001115 [Pleurodeles waltl]